MQQANVTRQAAKAPATIASAADAARLAPFTLEPILVERVWGTQSLDPWYDNSAGATIGEAWLTGAACRIADGPLRDATFGDALDRFGDVLSGDPAGEFPLLVKLLFPADHLSVQVHPDDVLAASLRGEGVAEVRAKTECWYVLSAEPGSTVALGLKPGVTAERLQQTLGTVDMEPLLHHEPVRVGDMIYVDAGTVHAIGPGVVLLEVQQMSDTTYRLWDYGRPRELHLGDGLRATKLQTRAGKVAPRPVSNGALQLIHTPHFAVESFRPTHDGATCQVGAGAAPECVIALRGSVHVHCGDSALVVEPGRAAVLPAGCGRYTIEGAAGAEAIRCFVPARVAPALL